jgi:hypothetical protein
MGILRIDLTGGDDAARELINLIGALDGVEQVEEVADLMPHMDDADSSSAGLADDEGPGFHKIEVHARAERIEQVRNLAMAFAAARDVVVEFEDEPA